MSRMDSVFVARTRTPEEKEVCFAIRREVYVEEQKVLPEEDLDGLDDKALHFLALDKGQPVGTVRVRFKDNGAAAKIERLAALKPARGCGVGASIMHAVATDQDVKKASSFVLEAQTYLTSFYERLGYKASGEEFIDVRIPHRFMSKENPQHLSQKRTA